MHIPQPQRSIHLRSLMNNFSSQKGAALLVSLLIMGALFLIFATVNVHGIIRESGVILTLTHKKTAEAHASTCIEIALFRAASNSSYSGNETITLDNETCAIRPLFQDGPNWIIETEATIQNRTTRFRTTLSERLPATIISIERVVSF